MLVRTDPFRELDRLSQQLMGSLGTTTRPSTMTMDAWRAGDEFVVEFDLPGAGQSDIPVKPVSVPRLAPGCTSIWAQYTIRLPQGRDRDGPGGRRAGRVLPDLDGPPATRQSLPSARPSDQLKVSPT